jgi:type IV secretory pathway TrbL component
MSLPCCLSARLLGKSLKARAQGFPIVFALTGFALVMERYAFLIAQLFNVFVTLLVAYMLF